jgi:hypothetical protein
VDKETQPMEIPGELLWGLSRKCQWRDFTGAKLKYQCSSCALQRTVTTCQLQMKYFKRGKWILNTVIPILPFNPFTSNFMLPWFWLSQILELRLRKV